MVSIANVTNVIFQILSLQVFVIHAKTKSLFLVELKTNLNLIIILWEDKGLTVLLSGSTESIIIFIFVSKFPIDHKLHPKF